MALQFYIGNPGSGKSYRLYHRVIEESQNRPEEYFVILVPEQFTMQTQKELVMLHPKKGIMNIDVLSFQRLACRVLDEVGGNNIPILDEVGKNFVVRKVAEERKDELMILGGNLKKAGYVNEIKSFLSEMMQYDISLQQLNEWISHNQSRNQLQMKLRDMAAMYEGFRTYIREKYITSEELLEVLYRKIEESAWVRNCTFILDGFISFTPVQKKLLEKLMWLAKDIRAAVTFDTRITYGQVLPDYHLFHISSKMLEDMRKMAEKNKVTVEEPVICSDQPNFRFDKNPALAALEQNLFRSRAETFEAEQEAVTVHICKNPLEEMKFAAEEICRLVMKKGYRYRDIAIVAGDMDTYARYAQRVLGQYEIPCFIDYKKNVTQNPMIEFLRSAINVAVKDFSYESMMRFLRTGLTNLAMEEIDELENYLLAAGIRGRKRWSGDWTEQQPAEKMEHMQKLNQSRQKIIQEIAPFAEVFRRTTTVREKTIAICKLLEVYQIQQKLKLLEEEFVQAHELSAAKEYAQIYRLVIQLFERLVELLGEEPADAEQYADLLEAGFSDMKVGIIPPGIDQVTVADIERSRLKQMKALIFLGVNDGFVPRSVTESGIISGLEREELKEQGMELAPGSQEQYYTQRFYLYLNLTKSEERLYLCFSKNDVQGNAIMPSYLIETIRRIYKNIEVTDEEAERKSLKSVVSRKRGMEYIIERWNGKRDADFYSLYQWFSEREQYKERLEQLKAAADDGKRTEGIDLAVSRALYGETLAGSVTRLEHYAACAYAHFLQYGLFLREREKYGFESMDFGNVLHEVLERYASKLKERQQLWTQVEDEQQRELIDICLEETVKDYGNQALYYTARDRYRIERIRRIAKRTVWALTKQLGAGAFQPDFAEISFKSTEDISDVLGEKAVINLRGRIDRTDVYEKDDKVYVKVVDYKTGHQEFKLLKLFYGLQLQLVVYLEQAVKLEQHQHRDKKVIPAGIVYYRIDDPLIDKDSQDTEQIVAQKMLKKLCVDGLIAESSEVLMAMDGQIGEAASHLKSLNSDVIPVAVKKDGMLSGTSKTATEEDFEILMKYTKQKIHQMGKEIMAGNIAVNPYREGADTACDFCRYKCICGFDEKGKGDRYREIEKTDEAELYQKMSEYDLHKEE